MKGRALASIAAMLALLAGCAGPGARSSDGLSPDGASGLAAAVSAERAGAHVCLITNVLDEQRPPRKTAGKFWPFPSSVQAPEKLTRQPATSSWIWPTQCQPTSSASSK